ncbi:MAG: hypothetical protein HWE34_04725 [Methylocystaceae bacterium]|nr:hypothetical protein [Methylocystaceae bacterium]
MSQNIRPKVAILLKEISTLLSENEREERWLKSFETLFKAAEGGDKDLRYKIKRMYGGMGSFNDLVLMSSEYKPDIEGNEKLDELRHQLYELITSNSEDSF